MLASGPAAHRTLRPAAVLIRLTAASNEAGALPRRMSPMKWWRTAHPVWSSGCPGTANSESGCATQLPTAIPTAWEYCSTVAPAGSRGTSYKSTCSFRLAAVVRAAASAAYFAWASAWSFLCAAGAVDGIRRHPEPSLGARLFAEALRPRDIFANILPLFCSQT